ncbi:cell envelope biogenesis protein TolA [Sphingomonas changnyeongensis]|uniref:Cell envelope biogenesis protein TolA n=1 Tax=Sphingomonas changnyeongensis TaxID=2698679 RepID=A0A7Z2NUY1_9SPHN|nr:cell envelope biogenesis protein TolA [Sphingomonas changnyeongensis]QHL90017.1 cell envelope biogenesis protein TolA [Sphingomonas changnyeongensis]
MDRAERLGLGIAAGGHVLAIGLLSIGFFAAPLPLTADRPPVEVQFVEDVGLEAATPDPAKTQPATSIAPELGQPEPAAEPVAAPAPRPDAPAPRPRAADKPAPAKAATETAKPPRKPAEASAAAPPKGARLGPDFLKGIAEKASASRSTATDAPIGPKEQGALAAELIRQLKPHWKPPSGADVDRLRVTIVANLSEDGAIVGELRVIGPSGVTASNRAQADVFVERALAAVRRAAPYRLPKQYYAAWRVIRPQLYEGL